MEPAKRDVIFVLGAPGAGKGTLCKRLAQHSNLKHLSVGDLLRRVISSPPSGDSDGADKVMREYIRRGELLPTEMLFSTISPELLFGDPSSEDANHSRPVLLDGFPRRLEQCRQFENVFGRPALVLFFDCPRDLAEQRVVTRQAGRAGDNIDMFRKRHDEFLELNPPILGHFEEQGNLVIVDTSGETDRSWDKLLAQLQASPAWKALEPSM